MASSDYRLQKKTRLEREIRTLLNEGLKKICQAYGYQVSGPKAVLVTRCIEILNFAVDRHDAITFEDLEYRVHNRGDPRPAGALDMPRQMNMLFSTRGEPRSPRHPWFKSSPFYERLEPLIPLQDLPDMPRNRHAVKAYFPFKQEAVQTVRGDRNLKILLYCGLAKDMTHYSSADVAFPGQVELQVNDNAVQSDFKGLKNKPGSTKPVDITAYIKSDQNIVQLTYALTTQRYAYTVYLVTQNSTDQLVERITKRSIICRQTVLNNMSKANEDAEIVATSFRMSLKDPISTLRINIPIRSSNCTHYQCFDGAMFMQLQEQAPQWSCPVCSKAILFESLCVDEYFQEILAATPRSTEKIDVEPNGKWKVVKDENEEGFSNKPRASNDDDLNDDLVEAVQPSEKSANGMKRQHDDDEQPPRSPKRQKTNQQTRHSNQSNAYNTPNRGPEAIVMNTTPTAFGQPSFPIQLNRPPSQFHLSQTYSNNNSNSFRNHGGLFPSNSQFANRTPPEQTFYQDLISASTNISSGGLRVPPPKEHQYYQQRDSGNLCSSSQAPLFPGGWRSDGNDYGYYYNSDSPP